MGSRFRARFRLNSPRHSEGTKQVLPTLQRALVRPAQLGDGGVWQKALDGVRRTTNEDGLASRLKAVCVCGGGGLQPDHLGGNTKGALSF